MLLAQRSRNGRLEKRLRFYGPLWGDNQTGIKPRELETNMADTETRFTSVRFKNYKALKSYSVILGRFNVMVGPNNAGKSTILGAFRLLAEGIRRARSRAPVPARIDGVHTFAFKVPVDDLPVSTENIFHNYDDGEPARVTFKLSNKNELELHFPEVGSCYLVCRNSRKAIRSSADFKREFPVSVGLVPVLGPVEHQEQLFQKEAARRALLTHSASRNFRNIWYHFPNDFDRFRELVRTTWPGMDIESPVPSRRGEKVYLDMFCPEDRYPREIYWAGFGFQVWCQMLTYLLRSKADSLLIIDEPDIYLHSDLQRQLLRILEQLGPDILLATHSAEIISEAEPSSLLVVNKKFRSSQRMQNASQISSVLKALGSNLNPTLTQLAKTRRALFLEGADIQMIAAFAGRLGVDAVVSRAEFAVISIDGFNPQRLLSISKGIEITLGVPVQKAVALDRDYRSDEELAAVAAELQRECVFVHIHERKEIENYLLDPVALTVAVKKRCAERERRSGVKCAWEDNMEEVLEGVVTKRKLEIQSQYVTRQAKEIKARNPSLDMTTANMDALGRFEGLWATPESRLRLVPGKAVLGDLNAFLQEKYGVSVTPALIVASMSADSVPMDLRGLIGRLSAFCRS